MRKKKGTRRKKIKIKRDRAGSGVKARVNEEGRSEEAKRPLDVDAIRGVGWLGKGRGGG